MNVTLLGSAYASLEWITLGVSSGEYFSVYFEFVSPPYKNSRRGYIREKFEENQYSARWLPIFPVNGETHVIHAPEFTGMPREFQYKEAWVADYTVDFYQVNPSEPSEENPVAGLLTEYFSGLNFDTLLKTEIISRLYIESPSGVPSLGVPSFNWSVKASGEMLFPGGNIKLRVYSYNSGEVCQLWIDGYLIKDYNQGESAYMPISEGWHEFLFLGKHSQNSRVQFNLLWTYPGATDQQVPSQKFRH